MGRQVVRTLMVVLLLARPHAGSAQARTVVPERGSPLRREIVDALRAPVQAELRQPVIFEISTLRVRAGWAFMTGAPRAAGGGRIDYGRTRYRDALGAGAFDDGISALLRLRAGRWTVVRYVIGATDVPWVDWESEFGAPHAIFPF